MDAPEFPISAYGIDDALFAQTRSDAMPRVRVYRPHGKCVVLGRGSKPEIELDMRVCASDGIPVLKRMGGGCSVVLDTGNVIVSAVLPVKGLLNNHKYFDCLSNWLIDGLERIGIHGVYTDGVSDLVIGGRKIGGACIYRSRDILLYSSTLLVDPDLECVARYLKHPPREPDYRKGRSHKAFMGALAPAFWAGDGEELASALRRNLLPGMAMRAIQREARLLAFPPESLLESRPKGQNHENDHCLETGTSRALFVPRGR